MGAAAIKAKKAKQAAAKTAAAIAAFEVSSIDRLKAINDMLLGRTFKLSTSVVDGRWFLHTEVKGVLKAVELKEQEDIILLGALNSERFTIVNTEVAMITTIQRRGYALPEGIASRGEFVQVLPDWVLCTNFGTLYQSNLETIKDLCALTIKHMTEWRAANPPSTGDVMPVSDEFFSPWKED